MQRVCNLPVGTIMPAPQGGAPVACHHAIRAPQGLDVQRGICLVRIGARVRTGFERFRFHLEPKMDIVRKAIDFTWLQTIADATKPKQIDISI